MRVGSVRGVPILVAPSWLLVAVLLTAVYTPVLRNAVDGLGAGAATVAALGFAVVFAGCVLLHEVGHSLVSIALGHRVRSITLFALGGVSEIDGEPDRARDELLISAAGPLVSVGIAAAAWGLWQLTPDYSLLGAFAALLCWSNAVLAAFNLLPGLPLDGGRLLRAAVFGLGASRLSATRVAAWVGRLVALAVVASAFFVERGTGGVAAAVMSVALGAYLWFGAGQAVVGASVTARLPGIDVAALLRPGLFVRADVSVAEALRQARATGAQGLVLLDAADRPSALVDEVLISAVPLERQAWTPVSSVARPLTAELTVPATIAPSELLEHIQAAPAREYLVVDGAGAPVGLLNARDFARQLTGARGGT